MAKPPPADLPPVIDDFEMQEQIGEGAFSHVYIARHKPTGCYVAAKVVELDRLKPHEFDGIMREISVFMQVQHPNICSIYRVSQFDQKLVFFIEYATNGTLLRYVNHKGCLDEAEAHRIFIQVFTAIRFLHLNYFLVHRDLKLENILLDSENNVKLTDFGLASTFYCNTLHTFVGTRGYQPPEVLAGNEYDDKCDVWSLGVCLYCMMTGSLPFSASTFSYRNLVDEVENFTYPPSFSPQLIDLLRQMFQIHPESRPSMIALQTHPWLRGLPQAPTNIAPTPIVFYQVKNSSDIRKFKRRPTEADPSILAACKPYGIDPEKLSKELSEGIISAETTVYFAILHPLTKKPEPASPPKIKISAHATQHHDNLIKSRSNETFDPNRVPKMIKQKRDSLVSNRPIRNP